MDEYVPNTEMQLPDSSIWPHIALYAVQFLFLAGPLFRGRRELFSVIVVGLAVQAHLNPHFSNFIPLIQPFTIGWSFYLDTLSKFLFSGDEGPEAHYWRLDRAHREALGYPAFSWAKIRWAFALVFNQRGVRWNHQVKNVPTASTRRRSRFLALTAFETIKCLLIADLLFELNIRISFTSGTGTVGRVGSEFLTMRHSDWRWSILKTFTFGCSPYFMLSSQYNQLSLISVALGLTKPEDWPSPFGRLIDTTTVRDFWGKFWHQQLRRTLTSFTDGFADAIGIPRGTILSSYAKLYLAFAISGFFHAFSQLQMPSPTNISAGSRTLGIFHFFAFQALAITIEDFVQWCLRRAGLRIDETVGIWKRLGSLLGQLWVFFVLWASLPLAGNTFLRMRIGEMNMLPIQVMKPVVHSLVPIPPEYFRSY